MEFVVRKIDPHTSKIPVRCCLTGGVAHYALVAEGSAETSLHYAAREHAETATKSIALQIVPRLLRNRNDDRNRGRLGTGTGCSNGNGDVRNERELVKVCEDSAREWYNAERFDLCISAAMHGIAFDTTKNPRSQSSLYLLLADSYSQMPNYNTDRSTYYLCLAIIPISKIQSSPPPPTSSLSSRERGCNRVWYEFCVAFYRTGGRNKLNEGKYGESIGFLSRHLFYASVLYGPENVELDWGYYLLGRAFEFSDVGDNGEEDTVGSRSLSKGGSESLCEKAIKCYNLVLKLWQRKWEHGGTIRVVQLKRGIKILILMAAIEGLECAEGCESLSNRMREKLLEQEEGKSRWEGKDKEEEEEEERRANGAEATMSA